MSTCELCTQTGGELLWQGKRCRVVHIDEPGYAGFCRVIWNAHVKEMTDLADDDRTHLMHVVLAVEAMLREQLNPLKINLASLGNLVAHLHWHVIPRYADDPHFPLPIWAGAQREASPSRRAARTATLANALARVLD
ncbi:MAG: HIT family protein [Pseudomonadota bacterium]